MQTHVTLVLYTTKGHFSQVSHPIKVDYSGKTYGDTQPVLVAAVVVQFNTHGSICEGEVGIDGAPLLVEVGLGTVAMVASGAEADDPAGGAGYGAFGAGRQGAAGIGCP